MATEDVRVTNWPASEGSPEAIAYKLWGALRYAYSRNGSLEGDLDLFAKCLDAARDRRTASS